MTMTVKRPSEQPGTPHVKKPIIIGWREFVDLPELGLTDLRAKIDTGALTSALHARNLRVFEIDGTRWVEFRAPGASRDKSGFCRFPVHDERRITNTSGIPEMRIVIRQTLVIAGHHWKFDLSLTDRSKMSHPIIIGRSALRRHGLLVDSGRSFLARNSGTSIVPSKSNNKWKPK